MIPRIYFPRALIDNTSLVVDGEEHHYLVKVLRARVGDPVDLFDGRGARANALIEEIGKVSARLRTTRVEPGLPASRVQIHLIQGIAASDKMDWIIEKAVELGVARIQPLTTRRSTVRFDAHRLESRLAHWRRIAIAAARQSGNDHLPPIEAPASLNEWLAIPPSAGVFRLALCAPAAQVACRPLSGWRPIDSTDVGMNPFEVELLIGPESGFDALELESALASGFTPLSMGARTLRCETAAVAAIAALQVRFGDF